MRRLEIGVVGEDCLGSLAGDVENLTVGAEVGYAQVECDAALHGALDVARTAQLHVGFGDSESVVVSVMISRRWRVSLAMLGFVIRMQYDWSAPRPTRPRSWCSCDSPKRSAFSITITEAFGTLTPTSIT